ncbi:MAG: LON peptidase substrate-binding domain-containing protein [Gammaproteobacteria bacterium]|nr:LON peptidase substrate-binding domain-containing protein [Gammaproteobacteria bacterium]
MAEIPLFPLPVVLFPGGKLPIEVSEARYLDMIGRCMKENVGFGVVLIEEGDKVLNNPDEQLPTVSWCGTYATIVDFDQNDNGMLNVIVEGQIKFVVRDFYETSDRLMMARVEFIELEEEAEIPENQQHLVNLLEMFLEHEAVQSLNLDINYEQAREVGARLTELLPCPNHFKQRMLEMKNPLARLKELEKLIDRMQNAKS